MAKKQNKPQKQSRIRVQFDIGYTGTKGETNKGKDQTIPDMNLTVRQLLENHTRGKDSDVEVRKPLYFDLPVPVIKDITDVELYKKQLLQQLEATNEFIDNEKAEAEAQKELDKDQPKSTAKPSTGGTEPLVSDS